MWLYENTELIFPFFCILLPSNSLFNFFSSFSVSCNFFVNSIIAEFDLMQLFQAMTVEQCDANFFPLPSLI